MKIFLLFKLTLTHITPTFFMSFVANFKEVFPGNTSTSNGNISVNLFAEYFADTSVLPISFEKRSNLDSIRDSMLMALFRTL